MGRASRRNQVRKFELGTHSFDTESNDQPVTAPATLYTPSLVCDCAGLGLFVFVRRGCVSSEGRKAIHDYTTSSTANMQVDPFSTDCYQYMKVCVRIAYI